MRFARSDSTGERFEQYLRPAGSREGLGRIETAQHQPGPRRNAMAELRKHFDEFSYCGSIVQTAPARGSGDYLVVVEIARLSG